MNLTMLFKSHHTRFVNKALQIVKNKQDAEDVVQEAFLNLHRKSGQFLGNAKPETYVYSVVVRAALSRLRAQQRHRRRARIDWAAPVAVDTERRILAREKIVLLQSAARMLQSVDLAILELAAEGENNFDIAMAYGAKYETTKSRLNRTRARLRESVL